MGWVLVTLVLIGVMIAAVLAVAAALRVADVAASDEDLDRDEELGEDATEPASKGPRDWSKDGFLLRRTLLTPAEQEFQRALIRAVDGGALIMAQVALEAIVRARRGAPAGVRGRLRRTVDFVLCDPASTAPRLVIELDDSSHRQRGRQQRDASIEQILTSAKLPLLRIAWARQYDPAELRQRIHAACGIATVSSAVAAPGSVRPAATPMQASPIAPASLAPLPVAPLPVASMTATRNTEPQAVPPVNVVRTVGQPTGAGRRVGVAASPRPPTN